MEKLYKTIGLYNKIERRQASNGARFEPNFAPFRKKINETLFKLFFIQASKA